MARLPSRCTMCDLAVSGRHEAVPSCVTDKEKAAPTRPFQGRRGGFVAFGRPSGRPTGSAPSLEPLRCYLVSGSVTRHRKDDRFVTVAQGSFCTAAKSRQGREIARNIIGIEGAPIEEGVAPQDQPALGSSPRRSRRRRSRPPASSWPRATARRCPRAPRDRLLAGTPLRTRPRPAPSTAPRPTGSSANTATRAWLRQGKFAASRY